MRSYISNIAWLLGVRGDVISWAYAPLESHRALLQDIKSGYISAISFDWIQTKCGRPTWHLTVKKKAGGLRDGELKIFHGYCDMLRRLPGVWPFHYTDVTVKITDLEGGHIEEWYAYVNRLMCKKVGREWWKGSVDWSIAIP
jgi:hypothetical protein